MRTKMFGAPTYKWLPAKSRMRTRFLFFYCAVPAGFTGVSERACRGRPGQDKDKSGKIVTLNARLQP